MTDTVDAFTGEEISKMAEDAGLAVVDYDDDENWAVLRAANLRS